MSQRDGHNLRTGGLDAGCLLCALSPPESFTTVFGVMRSVCGVDVVSVVETDDPETSMSSRAGLDVSSTGVLAGLKRLAQVAESAPLLSCGNLRCPTCKGKDDVCRHGELWLSFDFEDGAFAWEIEVMAHDQTRNFGFRDADLATVVARAVEYVDRERPADAFT